MATFLTVLGYVGSFFAGILAKYLGDKLTDARKKKESTSAVRKEFERCRKQMPELIEEMKVDLANNPLKSEFVLLDIRLAYGGFPEKPLMYFMDDDKPGETYRNEKKEVMVHAHLLDKAKMLESAGFLTDIRRTNVPYFRMTDEFKELLKEG